MRATPYCWTGGRGLGLRAADGASPCCYHGWKSIGKIELVGAKEGGELGWHEEIMGGKDLKTDSYATPCDVYTDLVIPDPGALSV